MIINCLINYKMLLLVQKKKIEMYVIDHMCGLRTMSTRPLHKNLSSVNTKLLIWKCTPCVAYTSDWNPFFRIQQINHYNVHLSTFYYYRKQMYPWCGQTGHTGFLLQSFKNRIAGFGLRMMNDWNYFHDIINWRSFLSKNFVFEC